MSMRILVASVILLWSSSTVFGEWRMIWDDEAVLFENGKQVGNYNSTYGCYRSYDWKTGEWGKPEKEPPIPITFMLGRSSSGGSALMECNAKRAGYGLNVLIEDPGLTIAAQRAAEYRAANLISGHTENDFQFIPAGCFAVSAGCAAWPPHYGWGSCCTEDSGYTYGGAGWAWGRDGQRYMHLFVR